MTLTDYRTTADVAAALELSVSTVRAYHARGQMPAASATVGRTPIWASSAIDPWIAEHLARRARLEATGHRAG